MSRRVPISPGAMLALGWTRVDARPWGKLTARWKHVRGWRLEHCGHPTALHPWALYSPAGDMVGTGAKYCGNPKFGTAWNTLREAVEWLDGELRAGRGAA